MNNFLNEYFWFNFELNIELNQFLARFNVKMNNQNVSATPIPPTVASSKAVTANSIVVSTIWWQRTGVGCILKSDVYGGSPVYDALLVWHSEFWVTHFYHMRWFRVRFEMPRCWQCSAILLKWGIFTVKWGGGHIYGNNFYRKYAPHRKFSPQNWQIYAFFYIWNATFFCDVNKLPNLYD